jgi:hypothetical protein
MNQLAIRELQCALINTEGKRKILKKVSTGLEQESTSEIISKTLDNETISEDAKWKNFLECI